MKNPVILLALTSAILLVGVIVLYSAKEGERAKKVSIQKELDTVAAAKLDAELRLRELEVANAGLMNDLAAQRERHNAVVKELENEKAMSRQHASAIKESDAKMGALMSKIDDLREERDSLMKDLEKLNEEYLNVKFYLANMLNTKEEMEKKAKELAEKQGVSLGTIVINQK